MSPASKKYWRAVDFDGTLAYHEPGGSLLVLGEPIAPMVARVQRWLADGETVKILTARVSSMHNSDEIAMQRAMIESWCRTHLGTILEIVCEKDGGMIELWDDRAVSVHRNTGERTTNDAKHKDCSYCGTTFPDRHADGCIRASWDR